MDESFDELEERLGYSFTDRGLLATALTHASWPPENDGRRQSNGRLALLGDAVMALMVGSFLYRFYPDAGEGDMTQMRAAACNQATQAFIAERFGLGGYVLLGRGEQSRDGSVTESILAGAIEALLGAVYRDGGLDSVTSVFWRILDVGGVPVDSLMGRANPKGVLQEASLSRYGANPLYRMEERSGPSHCPVFVVSAVVDGEPLGVGKAASIQTAEALAATAALRALGFPPGTSG